MSKNLTFQNLSKSPSSSEAEIAVLGGLILDNSSWFQVADILQENDFFNEQHKACSLPPFPIIKTFM